MSPHRPTTGTSGTYPAGLSALSKEPGVHNNVDIGENE
jgi:hypothetical protein